MKLKENFIVQTIEDEAMLVPLGGETFCGIVRGNAVLGELLSLLEKGTTREEIVSTLAERYDAPAEVLERDADEALAELRSIGALEE